MKNDCLLFKMNLKLPWQMDGKITKRIACSFDKYTKTKENEGGNVQLDKCTDEQESKKKKKNNEKELISISFFYFSTVAFVDVVVVA